MLKNIVEVAFWNYLPKESLHNLMFVDLQCTLQTNNIQKYLWLIVVTTLMRANQKPTVLSFSNILRSSSV